MVSSGVGCDVACQDAGRDEVPDRRPDADGRLRCEDTRTARPIDATAEVCVALKSAIIRIRFYCERAAGAGGARDGRGAAAGDPHPGLGAAGGRAAGPHTADRGAAGRVPGGWPGGPGAGWSDCSAQSRIVRSGGDACSVVSFRVVCRAEANRGASIFTQDVRY